MHGELPSRCKSRDAQLTNFGSAVRLPGPAPGFGVVHVYAKVLPEKLAPVDAAL